MDQQPYHRKVTRVYSCPTPFQQSEINEEQIIKDFYRECLESAEHYRWLDLMDSESKHSLHNNTSYWLYFNDVSDRDAGVKVKNHQSESEIIQKTEKLWSQEEIFRNTFNLEKQVNSKWENASYQDEELTRKDLCNELGCLPHGLRCTPIVLTGAVHLMGQPAFFNKRQHQAYDHLSEGKNWLPIYFLGSGNFGDVTLVYDKKKKLVCAAKEIPRKHYRQEELEIWKSLNAVNIVQLFGSVVHGDCVIFFMELVNGGTLSALIKKKVCLSHKVAIKYFKMLLDALDYLHRCSIIHNDVKGDNILLSDNEQRLLLCDFTFAQRLPLGQLTPKGEAPVGTQTHMAPEVAQSIGHDWRADVWSATCTLLHMINGRQPWLKKFSEIHVLYKVIVEESPPYFEIPPSCHILVDSLIKRGLIVDQYKRPFASTLRDEAADTLAQISDLQFIFGDQYTEVSSPFCNENISETSQYSSPTTLELSFILKYLPEPIPGSDHTPNCEDKVNEGQIPNIVFENSCEKQQSPQGNVTNTIERNKKDVDSSRSHGSCVQTSTLKTGQQPCHRKVNRIYTLPTSFQQPKKNEDDEQIRKGTLVFKADLPTSK